MKKKQRFFLGAILPNSGLELVNVYGDHQGEALFAGFAGLHQFVQALLGATPPDPAAPSPSFQTAPFVDQTPYRFKLSDWHRVANFFGNNSSINPDPNPATPWRQ